MGLNKAKDIIQKVISVPVPPAIMLWGPPGCGKSAIIKQITEENKWGMVDVRLLLLNPVDLRGIPVPDREKGIAQWLTAGFLPRVESHGEKGILFLDEINAAPPTVQAAAYQLVLDRQCGEYVLPPGWKIITAGNRTNDRGIVNKMPSPLANRMIHLDVKPSIDDWKVWAYGKVHPKIISFLAYKADMLFKMPDVTEEIRAFPSPRSWTFASQMLNIFSGNEEQLVTTLSASVGESTTHEFMLFDTVYSKLPDINRILATGEGTVPKEPDVIYALCTALIAHISQGHNKQDTIKKMTGLLKYLQNIPKEFQAWTIADIMRARIDNYIYECGEELSRWAKQIIDYIITITAGDNR